MDWVALFGAAGGLGLLVWLGEALQEFGVGSTLIRRGVHVTVGLFVTMTPFLFSGPGPVYLLAALFVLLNAAALMGRWWPGLHAARPDSWGTVAMPLALIAGLAVTWSISHDRVLLLQIAFLIVAVSDPLAAWVGTKWGRYRLVTGASLLGSGAFFASAGVLTVLVLSVSTNWGGGAVIGVSVLVAAATGAVEMTARRGLDNLWIVVAALLVLIPVHRTPALLSDLGVAAVVGIGFGAAAYAARSLTPRASIAGGLFAASLVGLGGWAWALPGFVFFGLSSALSVLPPRGNNSRKWSGGDWERRTVSQVLANGGVAWLLLAVFAVLPEGSSNVELACYVGFLGALAAAAADTWATEVGTRFARSAWSLRTGQSVCVGTSGAISVVGTVAAALGAGSIGGAALLTGPGAVVSARVWWVTVAGVVGMAVDSVCGATIQARYIDPQTERVVETPPHESATPIRGWSGVNNNIVNLLGTTAGAITALVV